MKKQMVVAQVFIILCILVGGMLGVYLIGLNDGAEGFDYNLALAVVVGTAVGAVVPIILNKRHKKKNGNIPIADERTILIMKRYSIAVLYIILVGFGALLLTLFALGVESIKVELLIVGLMFTYILIGIGAFIVKKITS